MHKSDLNDLVFEPTESAEAQGAGGRGPLHVAHRVHVGHMFATRCLPWKTTAIEVLIFVILMNNVQRPQSAGVRQRGRTEEDLIVS